MSDDMEYYESWDVEDEDIPELPPCCEEALRKQSSYYRKREKEIKKKSDEAIATVEEVYSGENIEIEALNKTVENYKKYYDRESEDAQKLRGSNKKLSCALERAIEVVMADDTNEHEWHMKFQAYEWAMKELKEQGIYV